MAKRASHTAALLTSAVVVFAGAGAAVAQDPDPIAGLLGGVLSPQYCVSGQVGAANTVQGTQENDCHQNSASGGLLGPILSPKYCISGQVGHANKVQGNQKNDCHQNSTHTPGPTPTPTTPPTTPPPTTPPPTPTAVPIYNSIPDVLPGNVASQAFEAQRTSEFGDEVQFGGTERELASMEVAMSSWACESGSGTTCTTTPGATFTHPITMNIYAVDDSGTTPAPGALLASRTENSSIPFRPSADNVNCTGGRWFNTANSTCYNGFAFRLKFDFPAGTTLPERVIWTVAFNTTHAGANPIGTDAPCYSAPTGCPYDGLNVGAQTFPGAPYQGIDVDPDAVFLNSTDPAAYCDGGAGGTGVLRFDSPCWTDNKPLAKITAV